MKPNNGKIPVISAVSVLTLVLAFAIGAYNLPETDRANTAQKEVSSSAAYQSKSDSAKEGKRGAKPRKRKTKALADEESAINWRTVKQNFLHDMSGTALGGWWRMEDSSERLVYLNMDPDYRVFEPDNATEYGYSLIGEGSVDSMDPPFMPVNRHPFDLTEATETTFTFSDGTRYVWRKDNQGTLELFTNGSELFTSELVRMDYTSVPFALRLAVARADYNEQYGVFPLADIADPTYVDGLQVLSGTIRVALESELFNEKFGIEPEEPATDVDSSSAIAELVLDRPTFLEGEHASSYGIVIDAIQTIGLNGGGADWLSMDGRRVTIAVNTENVTHPSDVQPCDAWVCDAELW